MIAVVCTCPPVPREPSQLARASERRQPDGRSNFAMAATTTTLSLASRCATAHRRLRATTSAAARVPRRPRALAVVAAAGKKGEAKTGMNLIKPKPMYAKGEEPWWIDPETGKAPGYLQITVFMASQLFVGMVMQPFALWYGQLFEPYVQNCTGIGC